jgi:hypothetical protein
VAAWWSACDFAWAGRVVCRDYNVSSTGEVMRRGRRWCAWGRCSLHAREKPTGPEKSGRGLRALQDAGATSRAHGQRGSLLEARAGGSAHFQSNRPIVGADFGERAITPPVAGVAVLVTLRLKDLVSLCRDVHLFGAKVFADMV